MSYTVIAGATVRFYTSTPFTSLANTVVDPDVVTFTWAVQGQTSTTYTYTTGATPPDPSFHIVRDSAGTFHADLNTVGLGGTWRYQWNGQPGISGLDTTKTSTLFDGTLTVTPAAF